MLLMFVTTALAMCAVAQKHADEHEIARARKQLTRTSELLEEMFKKPDRFIPPDLLEKADAIALFPRVVIGGRGGDGIIIRRLENCWSMPVFYKIGAGFVPQTGAKKTDYIVLFMNDDAVQHLQDDKFEFSGDVSFAAGAVKRTAGEVTDAGLETGVLTWWRSGGAFVGTSIKGVAITPDNNLNLIVYGMKARDLITSSTIVSKRSLSMETNDFPWRSTRD